MFKGLGDMAGLLKQAQQMQAKMLEAQERVAALEAEGESGAGLVRATVDGKGALKRLAIDPSLMTPEDRETLEDLVVAAVAQAQERAQEKAQAEMASITAGLPLPPGVKSPFG
ncbi:MAG: YbaB/EbfC family nucleoid-associated protein [Rubrimonas sp.]|uniref:YbaB/EbfC family nucleoid-associated protein n=1 Tax=Rubrimonas sp. TaxID=2036015 RepID=UPI002FDCCB04